MSKWELFCWASGLLVGFIIGTSVGADSKEKYITDKLFKGKAVQTISYPEFEKLINNN